jgi:hypothetical protein
MILNFLAEFCNSILVSFHESIVQVSVYFLFMIDFNGTRRHQGFHVEGVKISKALVLPHVKRLENEMVRMLLVVVSLVCQLRELVSIV